MVPSTLLSPFSAFPFLAVSDDLYCSFVKPPMSSLAEADVKTGPQRYAELADYRQRSIADKRRQIGGTAVWEIVDEKDHSSAVYLRLKEPAPRDSFFQTRPKRLVPELGGPESPEQPAHTATFIFTARLVRVYKMHILAYTL
ncbi:hypothetical protein SAPIO_CDS5239 [Scedosporium apiospermum]|uniref:Uncharacterized protein n=1 Tax=Pseudallescheria apiosperma TaxID=563466 RepID=A0A084G659_PSEDA|nr:uncharacterized protein SAPIO_CDS5239 [Scedosporium apiospermum]KEZ42821.1 hypothetical protein SAPIO_CDS5239 [Scedosporium apiospermum]